MKRLVMGFAVLISLIVAGAPAAQAADTGPAFDPAHVIIATAPDGTPAFYPRPPFRVFYPRTVSGERVRLTLAYFQHTAGSRVEAKAAAGGTCPAALSADRCATLFQTVLNDGFSAQPQGRPALLTSANLVAEDKDSPVIVWFGLHALSMRSGAPSVQIAEWHAADESYAPAGTATTIGGRAATETTSASMTTVFMVRHGTAILMSSDLDAATTDQIVSRLHKLNTSI